MPIVRLLVYPSLAAVVFYFLIRSVLSLQIAGYDKGFREFSLVAAPFLVTFFSQLHRMDVLRRIERLERHIERLGISGCKDKV